MPLRSLSTVAAVATLALLTACVAAPRRDVVYEPAVGQMSAYAEFGKVESIAIVPASARTSGGGAVLGAVIGGIVGHQFGGGIGKGVATGVGVVGGAAAGNAIGAGTFTRAISFAFRSASTTARRGRSTSCASTTCASVTGSSSKAGNCTGSEAALRAPHIARKRWA